jgi:hypothetical protein
VIRTLPLDLLSVVKSYDDDEVVVMGRRRTSSSPSLKLGTKIDSWLVRVMVISYLLLLLLLLLRVATPKAHWCCWLYCYVVEGDGKEIVKWKHLRPGAVSQGWDPVQCYISSAIKAELFELLQNFSIAN